MVDGLCKKALTDRAVAADPDAEMVGPVFGGAFAEEEEIEDTEPTTESPLFWKVNSSSSLGGKMNRQQIFDWLLGRDFPAERVAHTVSRLVNSSLEPFVNLSAFMSQRGWDDEELNGSQVRWTFGAAILYGVTAITTIGTFANILKPMIYEL